MFGVFCCIQDRKRLTERNDVDRFYWSCQEYMKPHETIQMFEGFIADVGIDFSHQPRLNMSSGGQASKSSNDFCGTSRPTYFTIMLFCIQCFFTCHWFHKNVQNDVADIFHSADSGPTSLKCGFQPQNNQLATPQFPNILWFPEISIPPNQSKSSISD